MSMANLFIAKHLAQNPNATSAKSLRLKPQMMCLLLAVGILVLLKSDTPQSQQ